MNPHISLRLRPEDLQVVDSVCRARGETRANFIRRAIRRELASLNYLNEEERKALGVVNE